MLTRVGNESHNKLFNKEQQKIRRVENEKLSQSSSREKRERDGERVIHLRTFRSRINVNNENV